MLLNCVFCCACVCVMFTNSQDIFYLFLTVNTDQCIKKKSLRRQFEAKGTVALFCLLKSNTCACLFGSDLFVSYGAPTKIDFFFYHASDRKKQPLACDPRHFDCCVFDSLFFLSYLLIFFCFWSFLLPVSLSMSPLSFLFFYLFLAYKLL